MVGRMTPKTLASAHMRAVAKTVRTLASLSAAPNGATAHTLEITTAHATKESAFI